MPIEEGPARLAGTVTNWVATAKPMFFKEDGSIKWRTLALIGAGALGGAFFLPGVVVAEGMPVIAGIVGALGGVVGAAILDKVKPEGVEPASVAASGPSAAPAAEREPAAETPAPAVTPGGPPRGRSR